MFYYYFTLCHLYDVASVFVKPLYSLRYFRIPPRFIWGFLPSGMLRGLG
jgi:hypothetical protein